MIEFEEVVAALAADVIVEQIKQLEAEKLPLPWGKHQKYKSYIPKKNSRRYLRRYHIKLLLVLVCY